MIVLDFIFFPFLMVQSIPPEADKFPYNYRKSCFIVKSLFPVCCRALSFKPLYSIGAHFFLTGVGQFIIGLF